MQIATSIDDETLAIRHNTRSLLSLGYYVSSDGRVSHRPIRGRNGNEKFWTSPLVKALKSNYQKKIGDKLKVFSKLDEHQWNRMEEAIQAIGNTILVNPMLPEDYATDVDLVITWDKFKLFWVNWALQGSYFKQITIKGNVETVPVLPNQERALKGLKSLSAWAGWYAAFNEVNPKPRLFGDMLGVNLKAGLQPLVWFGGCLKALRQPTKAPDLDICTALVSIKTFGRALPPAYGEVLYEAARETITVLTTPFETSRQVRDLYHDAAVGISSVMPKALGYTHLSVCRSSSYLSTGEKGGKAAEICPLVRRTIDSVGAYLSIRQSNFEIWLRASGGTERVVYDCFGRLLVRITCADGIDLLTGRFNPNPFSVIPNYQQQFPGEPRKIPGNRRFFPENAPNAQVMFGMNSSTESLLYKNLITRALSSIKKDLTQGDILVYGLWPSQFPLETSLTPLATRTWLNNALALFTEQACIADLTARGIISWDVPPVGYIGGTHFEGLPGYHPIIPYWNDDRPRKIVVTGMLPCRLRSLGEPGFKARPLTIGSATANSMMQTTRFMLEPSFHHDQRTTIGFEEIHVLWNFNKHIVKLMKAAGIVNPTFINADFKSSTDYLPLDLIEEMWSGFFKGQRLGVNHPVHVFWPLQFAKRVIYPGDYATSRVAQEMGVDHWIQARGSFMGEPLSFLNLTLYNLCTVALVGVLQKRSPGRPLQDFVCPDTVYQKLIPCQIVGDDLLAIVSTGTSALYWHQELVSKTGMKFSDGKHLVSKSLMILCEDHCFYDGTSHFIDVVKIRLLTRATRVHSDNRASVISRGSQVISSINYNPSKVVRIMARAVYLDTFRKILSDKKFLPQWFPLELPNNVGGINIPGRDWDIFSEECSFILRFLQWVIQLDIEDFVGWYLRISRISGRRKKGVPIEVNPDEISRLFAGYKFGKLTDSIDSQAKIFGRARVIAELEKQGVEIPISPFTGMPINSVVKQQAKLVLEMVTVDQLLDYADRISAFKTLFEEPEKPKEPLSFAEYQRTAYKFFKKTIGSLETSGFFARIGKPLPEKHSFTNYGDIGRKFALRCQNYVSIKNNEFWFLRFGPTLNIRYHREPIVKRSSAPIGENIRIAWDHTSVSPIITDVDDD